MMMQASTEVAVAAGQDAAETIEMTAYRLAAKALAETGWDQERAADLFVSWVEADQKLYRAIADDLMRHAARRSINQVVNAQRARINREMKDPDREKPASVTVTMQSPHHAESQSQGVGYLVQGHLDRLMRQPVAFIGKAMRLCTPAELRIAAAETGKIGRASLHNERYYTSVAERVPEGQTVGRALKESDLEAIRDATERDAA